MPKLTATNDVNIASPAKPLDQWLYPMLAWLGIGALACSWLVLYRPTLQWLGKTLSYEAYRLNLILLVGIAGLLGKQWYNKAKAEASNGGSSAFLALLKWHKSGDGHPPWAACSTFVLGCVAYVFIGRTWDADILSATAMGIATYGAIGLFISREHWRRGWPAALLLITALPFGSHLDQLVGFPARILTANWSNQILASIGIGSLSTQSILVLENGIAHVDLPCSGVKSLWSGCLFFLALTWIERSKMGFRWFMVGVLYVAALLVANIVRVCLLIMVAIVAQQPQLAEIIHVPLGVIGFCVAGALAYLCFRLLPKRREETVESPTTSSASPPWREAIVLAAFCACLAALHQPQADAASPSQHRWQVQFASGLQQSALPLTKAERQMFRRHGKTKAHKVRFQWPSKTSKQNPTKGLAGSLLLVHSRTWRSHHPPEICLAGNGHRVRSLRQIEQQPGFTYRLVTLQSGKSAVYWYQSRRRATDILLQRILGSLRKGEKRWVMVSLLFDRTITPTEPHFQRLLTHLKQQIQASLQTQSTTKPITTQ